MVEEILFSFLRPEWMCRLLMAAGCLSLDISIQDSSQIDTPGWMIWPWAPTKEHCTMEFELGVFPLPASNHMSNKSCAHIPSNNQSITRDILGVKGTNRSRQFPALVDGLLETKGTNQY